MLAENEWEPRLPPSPGCNEVPQHLHWWSQRRPRPSRELGLPSLLTNNSPSPTPPQHTLYQWRPHRELELPTSLRSPRHFQMSQKKVHLWTSRMAQWLGIHLPMQGTRVWSLVREDPTCRGATKPVRHSYWACAPGPACHNYWSPNA